MSIELGTWNHSVTTRLHGLPAELDLDMRIESEDGNRSRLGLLAQCSKRFQGVYLSIIQIQYDQVGCGSALDEQFVGGGHKNELHPRLLGGWFYFGNKEQVGHAGDNFPCHDPMIIMGDSRHGEKAAHDGIFRGGSN
jgi:hypothetical protein